MKIKTAHKNIFYGFTLIELLVAIAVLGVATTVTVVSFRGGGSSARDARRQSDIRQYQSALETYASNNNGAYPTRSSAAPVAINTLCGSGQPLGALTCPTDPQPSLGWNYQYQSDAAGSAYIVWARLEKTSAAAQYFVLCSNGNAGKTTTAIPQGVVCPI